MADACSDERERFELIGAEVALTRAPDALGARRALFLKHWAFRAKLRPMAKAMDPIMSRFRAALDRAYGARIERVVLFGSRARGEARPDLDYDVAVFLKGLESFGEEAGRIAEIETEILYDTGAVINALPLKAGSYRDATGLMGELRREGVDL